MTRSPTECVAGEKSRAGCRRAASRRPLYWLPALPALAPHIVRTTPWATLLAGCLSGTVLVEVMAHVLHMSHASLTQNDLRFTFLTAVAALAFVPRTSFRPVSQSVAVPGWIFPVGQVVLSLPVVVVTGWLQLHIVEATMPPAARSAIYPLLAQLVAWSVIGVTTATCIDRTRYADLGGAVAAPLTFLLIAIGWYAPFLKAQLVTPPAAAEHATIGWYAIAAISLVATGLALRDPWQRYTKSLRAGRLWPRPTR